MEKNMKLYVLNGGRLWTEWAFHWHFGTVEMSGLDHVAAFFCVRSTQFYIDHPEAKIVYELGYKLEDFASFPGFPHRTGPEGIWFKQDPQENPVAQLALCGVKPDDIDYVVISHLMSEHAGWLPEFAGKKAKIIVQKKEWDYASRIATPIRSGKPPIEQFHSWMYRRKHFELPDLNYKFIEGDYEVVKGVKALFSPGHTPGYQTLQVNLPKTGTVILAACEHRGNYFDVPINGNGPGIPHAFTWFAGGELESFDRIRGILEKERGELFCGHDNDQWLTLKHAPEYYE